MANLIEARHLSKSFNLEAGFFARRDKTVYAVNDVSFAIESGKAYALAGESGCGKTTTARLLVKMYERDSGEIICSDENGARDIDTFSKRELRSYREKVKYIFQDPARALNPRMSVYDILASPLRHSSLWRGKARAKEDAERAMREAGLSEEDLQRRPSEFSGGQRQRISIARGLIMRPKVLICDEIVSALDVSVQGQIINLLCDLREKNSLGFLFITHDLKVACYFCDTIGVMYRGVIVEEAPAAALYKEAAHPYTRLLFDGALGRRAESNVEVKTTLERETGCPFAHRCPSAKDECRASMPPLSERAAGHKVRCFL